MLEDLRDHNNNNHNSNTINSISSIINVSITITVLGEAGGVEHLLSIVAS